MKTESQLIKEEFVRLRKFNSIVFNFNSNKYNNAGLTGFPDWVILTPKLNIVFIEIKIGKDSLREEQKTVLKRLSSMMGLPHSRIYYFLCRGSKEAKQIGENVLTGKL
jgi:hypothetical protein